MDPQGFSDMLKEMEIEERMLADGADAAPFDEKYRKFVSDVRSHLLGLGTDGLERIQTEAETRFSAVLPMNIVHETTIALVGLGGLGNWCWRVLLAMGFKRVHLFDPDFVDTVNILPQGHRIVDVGLPKTEAVRRDALSFRGIELNVYGKKVETVSDIVTEIGVVPNVVIGMTDSASFRNSMIESLIRSVEYEFGAQPVDLFVDVRMALGDWNCFLYTPRALAGSSMRVSRSNVNDLYRRLGIFGEDEAVQEPCTARAIAYTGCCVASYVGAVLHWWLTVGKTKCETDSEFLFCKFYGENRDEENFNWLYRFGSRTFLPETMTARQFDRAMKASRCVVSETALEEGFHLRWDGDIRRHVWQRQTQSDPLSCAYVDIPGHEHLFTFGLCNPSHIEVDDEGSVIGHGNENLLYCIDIDATEGTAVIRVKCVKDREAHRGKRDGLFVQDAELQGLLSGWDMNRCYSEYYAPGSRFAPLLLHRAKLVGTRPAFEIAVDHSTVLAMIGVYQKIGGPSLPVEAPSVDVLRNVMIVRKSSGEYDAAMVSLKIGNRRVQDGVVCSVGCARASIVPGTPAKASKADFRSVFDMIRLCGDEEVHGTGWRTLTRTEPAPLCVAGVDFEFRDSRAMVSVQTLRALIDATDFAEPASDDAGPVDIDTVGDGTRVLVDGVDGVLVKRVYEGVSYLEDELTGTLGRAVGGMMVTIVED